MFFFKILYFWDQLDTADFDFSEKFPVQVWKIEVFYSFAQKTIFAYFLDLRDKQCLGTRIFEFRTEFLFADFERFWDIAT